MNAVPVGRTYDVVPVEDDAADAFLIEDSLRHLGTARRIARVIDGVEALERLHTPDVGRPDLIVLDLNMPRMSGRELSAVLKQERELRTIPVVMLTTSDAPKHVAGACGEHANAYVTKPVSLDEFARAGRGRGTRRDAQFSYVAAEAGASWKNASIPRIADRKSSARAGLVT
ncbi:hypothetical protein B4N89_46810 [Embleya scabrispora]|uniref:Response regulatory domain-containing protein n=2 Tax=Embleya scabrispora TaxID=159449 RepID=A0A1T3NIB4_9ACTN|nr:hypothetical protein B4N89_46810 [Embleya scabrispora]